MTPERVMEIWEETFSTTGLAYCPEVPKAQIAAFASCIREEALREAVQIIDEFADERYRLPQEIGLLHTAADRIFSLIEKKP